MSATQRRVLAVGWIVFVLLALEASAEVELYKLRHRPAAELLPLAETALAGEGNAAIDARTNSLVLIGERAALQRALEILQQQDRSPRTVVVSYALVRRSELDEVGIEIRWRVESERGRIGNVVVGDGDEGTAFLARLEAAHATGGGSRTGTLRVLEGHRARISTGASRPYEATDATGVTTWVSAQSGFEVQSPHILQDGSVRIVLHPFEGRFRGRAVEHSGASTELVLRPGQTVAVAGVGALGEARETELGTRVEDGAASHEELLLVTVAVE